MDDTIDLCRRDVALVGVQEPLLNHLAARAGVIGEIVLIGFAAL